jgi:hypothetical protein
MGPKLVPFSQNLARSPFHFDALGLITTIGAAQLNRALGRLVRYRFADYLPLSGHQVIAEI